MIVSPDTYPEVIRAPGALDLMSIPGFFTPSGAFAALDAGADALRLFPAEVGARFAPGANRAVHDRSERVRSVTAPLRQSVLRSVGQALLRTS